MILVFRDSGAVPDWSTKIKRKTMPEDSYLRVTREYFAETNAGALDIPEKKLNTILKKYNEYIDKCLVDETPFTAKNLELAIKKSMEEEFGRKQED
jgi:hypothetical protein